jgi:biopolymer transport protein ExbD
MRKQFDSINVVPFIDIMLVLLVIVLTTATFIAKGIIPVDLSTAQSGDEMQPKKELVITIKANNEIYFDKEKIEKNTLEQKLLTYENTIPVSINADKKVAFEEFVTLLDMLKKHHYKNLGVITKNE